MSQNRIKVIGEGGVHLHKLSSPVATEKDGIHKHLFFINDRLLMTDLSGAHSHPVDVKKSSVGAETTPIHKHSVRLNTQDGMVDFSTKEGGDHAHELQSGTTTLSGLHTHELVLGADTYVSLLPGDLIQAVEQAVKNVPAFKNFKVRENNDTPLEMDFETVKRLNKADMKDILKTAAFQATIKSISNLKTGFQIQSLVLDREQFQDMGAATKFVTDHALDASSSEEITNEGKFVFTIQSKDRFVETSMSKVCITVGVTAVVGLLDSDEIGAQLAENKPAEAAPQSANPQTAQTPQEQLVAAVDGTISEMSDNLNNGGQMKSIADLKKKFANVSDRFGMTVVTKSATTSTKKFVNWKTNKAVVGSALETLQDLAEKNSIDKKFVTVEYPMKRYVEFLVTKYETISAVYENTAEAKDEKDYASLHVKGEGIEAFVIKTGRWNKDLVIFFDDEANLDEIFKTEINDYEFGAYQYRQTMMGPQLYPVEMAKNAFCILDEQLMANLKRDTEQFFSAETQDFFENNPDGHEMDYKRGIFMHGPPGNGKTTFIKNFLITQKDCYGILCEANDFDSGMGKFLAQRLGRNAKKALVFEDVDALAHRYEMRSSFLNFLDGVGGLHKVLILATSNYPHMLDDALLKRPSRFDQKYKIDLPNLEMRAKFLKHWFKKMTDVEASDFAKKTAGFSGAFFKELYILKNLQKCSIDEAIVRLKEQMQDIRKDAPVDINWVATILGGEEIEKGLVPDSKMDREALGKSQKARSKKWGIEILDGAALTFPAGFPTNLGDYADPVNLKYPTDTTARASNARVRFKQNASEYKQKSSQKVVHTRIVEAELAHGVTPSLDEKDPLDMMLPASLRARIKKAGQGKAKTLKDKFKEVSSAYGIEEKEETTKRLGFMEIIKKDDSKRLVTGPVLVPENVDLQDDIISAEEIEKAAHNYVLKLSFQDDQAFMKKLGLSGKSKRGFMHVEFNRKIALVESYCAPCEMTINGRAIKQGTWVMTVKVFDDEAWNLVKAGRITGFSIGGRSRAVPETKEATT